MAIAFDSATQGSAGATPVTQTYAHTCTGTNLILYVHIYTNPDSVDSVTGVTYAAVAMTRVDTQANSTGNGRATLYRLVAPATGANNVVISYTGATFAVSVATSYTGAKQSGGVFVTNKATGTNTVSISITPNSTDNWIAMACASGNNAPTAAAAAFLRQAGSNVAITAFDTNSDVSGATTMTCNAAATTVLGVVGESFEPAGAASSIKTIDGLAIASVKTVLGLARASVKTWNGLQ